MYSKSRHREEPQRTNEICSTCKAMTSTLHGLQALASQEGYKHLDRKMISDSAEQGCSSCAIIRLYPGYDANDGHIRVFAELENSNTRVEDPNFEHPLHGRRIKRLHVNRLPNHVLGPSELCAFTTIDDPAVKYLQVQPLSIPVMNGMIIEKIKKRLVECQKKHRSCPFEVTPTLPKRVVDVGAESSNPHPTLHISEPNEKALYVALSYCWGGPQEITTTLATLETYTSSLPAELPRTFQDAIQITRSLGFQYLWIDALCIIQDDDSDKNAEISGMGLVYKDATLTIAAASASSAKDGFLEDRPQLTLCQLPFYVTDDSCGAIWMHDPIKRFDEEPLDSRAWALQESLLSPRILYYATKDLMWKCQEDDFVAVNETHRSHVIGSCWRIPKDDFAIGSANTLVRTWELLVEEYSGRKLSVPEDRLPALAGLARELQIKWNDSYVAGMWRSCLVQHLGWWQVSGTQKNPITAYKSPGWSWVSHEGQIWISEVRYEEAEVIDVAVTLVNKSLPFDQVCSGRLVLRAPVLPGGIGKRLHNACRLDFSLDGLGIDDSKFLLLGYSSNRTSVGLILLPAEDETFMRVGYFSGYHPDEAPWSTDLVKREVITIV